MNKASIRQCFPPPSVVTTHHSPVFFFLFLTALCGFLFFYRLGDRDLWSSHEGRAAQDAQTILDDGNWGLPRLFDKKYLDLQKPPLYYWLVAAMAQLLGGQVDPWSVRLPAAFSGLFCVLGLYWFGCHIGRAKAGLIGAMILATAVHFTWLARIGRIDMPLALVIGVALGSFYFGWRNRQQQESRHSLRKAPPLDPASWPWKSWRWYLFSYLAVGVAILLKGPIGAVLPAIVMAAWLAWERDLPAPWRFRRWMQVAHKMGLWWGMPLTLALALPWFIWASVQTEGALGRSLWYHNMIRAMGGNDGMRARPLLFYFPRLAVDFLPWSSLLPAAFVYMFRGQRWRMDSEACFGAAWLVVILLLLSCVGFKRADYLLPAYPGAALLLGCCGERWLREVKHRASFAVAGGLVVASIIVGWALNLAFFLPKQEPGLEDRSFAQEIRQWAIPPDPVIFFRVEAHALAFHTGRPVDTILEWENLDFWASQPRPFYIVMEPDCADDWPNHLKSGGLERVISNVDLAGGKHQHPLVLMRTRPSHKKHGVILGSR
jgi:4-amino-4-deoxy-L-arabinose transferase-like glycosyltransferase